MAAKIRVKGTTDTVSKNAACYLVRHLLACWVTRNCEIELLEVSDVPSQPTRRLPAAPYIPDKLPLAELPGLVFEPPARPPTFFPVFPDLIPIEKELTA